MSDVLAWIDVETTGLDPHDGDELLEIACILTDTDLNQIADPITFRVYHDPGKVLRMKARTDEYVVHMHEASGLWDAVQRYKEACTLREIDGALLDYIKQHAPESRQARIAGNSLTLDLNFLKAFLPKTYEHLHYRSVDVTAIEYALTQQGFIVPRPKNPQHEALADIQDSIEQLRDIYRQLRAGRAQTTRHTNPPR
jgi:oligoribonuclease